ncbi:hypothetical protein JCM16776_0177 [Leptotrichia shahii]|uniref:Uncharacterized protein n=1 Tax=Leptotrichia shahii TaxID=157691 RepID=A0A510JL22_9FUSO|nr:hypothetical protein [Leptotrichia shahii]BBM39974.1 hypothetical protein JCM16776_0177 [Leptotrichia shahii]
MKKLFVLLPLLLFFGLNSKSLAYTRAELIQDRLSKIGIKQDIIDETIKLEYDIKDEKNFFTEDGKENDDLLKLKEIYEKDERNETLGATIAGAYMIGEQKDFKKARQYMDKISKYSSKFDRLSNEWSYYKLKGDEKLSKKYYDLLKRSYKGTPAMDLIEILNDNLEMISFLNTLRDYLTEEDNNSNSEANDLPDGFLYDEKNGIIQNKDDNDSDEAENTEKDNQTYSESIKEILDDGKDTIKSQKEEVSKYKRIVDYFKIDKNQKEFGIPNDYVRGFELKIAEIEIAKNMMNYGVGSAVKYYLDNVSTKDVSYEDVYFNEQSELELYLAVAQMLAIADESVVNKYRKDFENTRVIKLLDEVLKNERKKEKDKIENPDKNGKSHIKS